MYCNVLQIYSPQIGPKLCLKAEIFTKVGTDIMQNYVCLISQFRHLSWDLKRRPLAYEATTLPLADPGGIADTPPKGSNSFVFAHVFC